MFLKGFQHQNVIGRHYKLTFLTSYAMAILDVATVGFIIQFGWAVALTSGTGAAFGMVLSMWAHKKWVRSPGGQPHGGARG